MILLRNAPGRTLIALADKNANNSVFSQISQNLTLLCIYFGLNWNKKVYTVAKTYETNERKDILHYLYYEKIFFFK